MKNIGRSRFGFVAAILGVAIGSACFKVILQQFPAVNTFALVWKQRLGLGPSVPNPFPEGDPHRAIYARAMDDMMREPLISEYFASLVEVATSNHLTSEAGEKMAQNAAAERTKAGLTFIGAVEQAHYLQILTKILEKAPPPQCADIQDWPPSSTAFAQVFGEMSVDDLSEFVTIRKNALLVGVDSAHALAAAQPPPREEVRKIFHEISRRLSENDRQRVALYRSQKFATENATSEECWITKTTYTTAATLPIEGQALFLVSQLTDEPK